MEAAVQEAMQQHLIIKRYRCLVRGVPTTGMPVLSSDKSTFLELSAFLEKDVQKSDVYIHDQQQRNDYPIITRYRVLKVYTGIGVDGDAVSELEVELVTGRTHQIRAHMAHIGHPLVGDGKYGRNSFNRQFRGPEGVVTRQQLYAFSLIFSHKLKGLLASLAGRTFTVPTVYDFNPAALERHTQ
jgi:23S rRNA pseudouridine955/2504/2580 synthase